jgi:sacsin
MAANTDQDELGGFPVGQKEPLTVRLRGLIRDYPEGVGIVKELLQNADDSGARRLHIIIDWRTYPTDRLPVPEMAALQGPALLAFNDRRFTEEDIFNIQQIGYGGKVKSAAQTGRFCAL